MNTPSGQPQGMQAGEYTPSAPPTQVNFTLRSVAPPSDLYVQRDDTLVLMGITGISGGTTITLTVRLLRAADGQIDTLQTTLKLANNYAATSTSLTLAEGYLLSVSAFDSASTSGGFTYAAAYLQRGGSTFPLQNSGYVLFADWTSVNVPIGWPGGRQMRSDDGPGLYRVNVVANPVAGADWTLTVPNSARWELVTVNAQLTTAVAVANRQVQLQGTNAGVLIWNSPAAVNVPASTTAQISAMQGNTLTPVITTDVTIAIPPRLGMSVGMIIQSSTVGIQPADQWSNIRVGVRELLDV